MKKQLSIVIVMALVLTGSLGMVTVFADSSSSNKIPVKEYAAQMKAEYAKYGIEYNVVDYGTVKEVSKKVLDDQLADAKNSGELYAKSRAEQKARINEINQNLEKGSILQSGIVSPQGSMFIDKTFKHDSPFSYVGGLCKATIQMTVNTTCEANNREFVSVNSITSKQLGTAVNFKSWKQTGKDYNLKRISLFAWVTGDLTFEYKEPKTGMTVTHTTEEELSAIWGQDAI